MSKDFLQSENFKTRTTTGIVLACIVIVSFFTPCANVFRAFFIAAGIMSGIELYLAHVAGCTRGITMPNEHVITFEYLIIILAMYSIGFYLERYEILLVVLGAVSTDIFAYFVGSAFHDRLFKTRPFPRVSPKKSWEGIFGGVIGCIAVLLVTLQIMKIPFSHYLFFIFACPLAAIFGDFFASFCKRFLKIKDSSDYIYTSALYFPKLCEKLMKGHGGYLDRIDSISAVACLMFCIKLATL